MKIIRTALISFIIFFIFLNYFVFNSIFVNYGGKITIHNGYLPKEMNPLWHIRIEEFEIDRLLYSPLCNIDDDGNIILTLIENAYMEGNIWYFKIKNNIYFSSFKVNLTTYDVKNSLEYIKNSYNPYNFIYKNIKEIKIIDSLNFAIELYQPDPFLIFKLCHPSSAILRRWKNPNKEYEFLGIGPFKIKVNNLPDSLIIESNQNYYEGEPFLNQIIFYSSFKINPLFYFKMGSLDLISLYENRTISQDEFSNYPVLKTKQPVLIFLLLNPKIEPTSNKNFRDWLFLQLDKKGFLNSLFNGKGETINSLFTNYEKPSIINSGINKFNEELTILILNNDYMSKQIAERLQAILLAKRIRSQLIYYDVKDFLKRQEKGDFHILLSSTSAIFKNPDLNILFFASIYSYFRNLENIDLISYPQDFEINLLKKTILIPLISINREYLAKENIHFYRKNFSALSDFEYAWISGINTKK